VDALSDVITSLRTGRAHYARSTRPAGWAVRHQPFAGAGFHLVLEGSCWVSGPTMAPTALGAGDLVFLPGGSEHVLATDRAALSTEVPAVKLIDVRSTADEPRHNDQDEVRDAAGPTVILCGAYLMEQTASHPMLAELPQTLLIRSTVGRHRSLRAVIGLLADELDKPQSGGDAIIPALLDALLLYVLRSWFAEQSERHPDTGWAGALADPAIGSVLRAMHADCARPWTITELSTLAGLSRATLARRFTAMIGQPPLTYLTWWRMTVAARLLAGSQLTVAAVARSTGYTSEFAFAHAFKRAYGLPPGRYQRKRPSGDGRPSASAGPRSR
jgi:AraC-like DNA-binding protein